MHLAWRDIAPGPECFHLINTSMTEAEGAELARMAAGAHVLEIGAAYGFSSAAMALGGAESVTSVDPHTWCPGSLEGMQANLAAYEIENVRIVRDTFFNAYETLSAYSFDFIFIDGDHARETVKFDMEHAKQLIRFGGNIACHDYDEDCCPGVRAALDELFPDGPDRLVDTLAIFDFGRFP